MMKYDFIIVSASIEAFSLAVSLRMNDLSVAIIDINAELGLPCNIPGYIEDEIKLKIFCTDKEIEYLELHDNSGQYFGFNSEWIFKFAAQTLSELDVDFYTRSRVVEFDENSITISGAGPNGNQILEYGTLLDLSKYSNSTPGDLVHITDEGRDDCRAIFGGLCLSRDVFVIDADLHIHRQDGLCEVWSFEPLEVEPEGGWLAKTQGFVDKESGLHPIDEKILMGRMLAKRFVKRTY